MFSAFEKKINPFPEGGIDVPPTSFLPFLWRATDGVRLYIFGMGLLAAITGAFEAFLFYVLGNVVDWLAVIDPSRLWTDYGNILLVLALVILGSTALVAVQSMLKLQTIAANFPMRLRWNFHRLMLDQSMSFFQDEFAGRITQKVMQTAQALRDTCMIIVDIMVFASIYFVTMILTAASFDIWLLLPFGLWLAGYLTLLRWFVPRLAKASQLQAYSRSSMVGRITDAYTNIATVKLFSHSGREAFYARGAMREFLAAVRALMRKISSFQIINHLLSMSVIVGASGTALWLWSQGEVGIGALASVGAMTLRLNGMSHWIMSESTTLFEQVGTIHDGIQTLSRRQIVVDKPDAADLVVSKGEIRFDNVSFWYGDEESRPIIENLNLTIRPGEKIGLIGRSGAGKTTLVGLLLRFYDVQLGKILIDGQNIADITQDSLRAQIGLVMQDTSLLHRSVRDNILYGRPNASEEEMKAAVYRAEADEFIDTLMDAKGRRGYDTMVGERGIKLSGGQRQRIAIARVMLKNAPILLLDEATSALDSEVELAIQENLYRLMEGKTVVAIAHRLSTIAAMDRLVVMDKGKIVEEGDHQALLEKGGVYAHLWSHQSGGFLGADL